MSRHVRLREPGPSNSWSVHVQYDLAYVGVGLHVVVRGLSVLQPVQLTVDEMLEGA